MLKEAVDSWLGEHQGCPLCMLYLTAAYGVGGGNIEMEMSKHGERTRPQSHRPPADNPDFCRSC